MEGHKVTLIIPYRNREISRLQNSLNSLERQIRKDFEVIIVDYGSDNFFSEKINYLSKSYSFVSYYFFDTSILPWNRAHALNLGIAKCNTDFFFPSDVDLIYHSSFINKVLNTIELNTITTFKVSYLSKNNKELIDPSRMKICAVSTSQALGMTLFNRSEFEDLGRYDEKYIYWGGEDNDIVNRYIENGYVHRFYPDENLVYHQWHLPTEINEDAYPFGIKSFIREANFKFFQNNRNRGEVLEHSKDNFEIYEISAYKFHMLWEIDEILNNSKAESLISFRISDVRHPLRYTKGKQFSLFKILNRILVKFDFKIVWKFDESKYFVHEIRDEILKYKSIKANTFDLLGLEVSKMNVIVFIKKGK